MIKNNTALLMIDLINNFCFSQGSELAKNTKEIVPEILALKKHCKAKHIPIIYVNDNYGTNSSNAKDIIAKCDNETSHSIICDLFPGKEDFFIAKSKFSGFYNTNLLSLLKSLGITNLILTGVCGHICVLFTANDAYMRGFHLTIPADGYSCNTLSEKQFIDDYFANVFKANTQKIRHIIQ